MSNKITVFWFRRDLRLSDNVALSKALNSSEKVLPIFIFDENILDSLPNNDARVTFIYQTLKNIHLQLQKIGSSLLIKIGKPLQVWKNILEEYQIKSVFTNRDYEPYSIKRDNEIATFLQTQNIAFHTYKDQVIFEKKEIVKADKNPYTIFTPYKNKWIQAFNNELHTKEYFINTNHFLTCKHPFPSLKELGFTKSSIKVKPYNLSAIPTYDTTRNYPSESGTSHISPYLRFGLVSVRKMIKIATIENTTFLSELIWREFFMQILWHFPKVVTHNFKPKYDAVCWKNNEEEFLKWCEGKTGYPMVDAGMRELNTTGYMHNRVRMITAGFLCKHLLIDWRWGEAYFAQKLLDYELASNNGNWQWAAGTGCDAAPYFRIFNPSEQLKKFDKNLIYIKKWINDFDELTYPKPMVEHKTARLRAIETYKKAIHQI